MAVANRFRERVDVRGVDVIVEHQETGAQKRGMCIIGPLVARINPWRTSSRRNPQSRNTLASTMTSVEKLKVPAEGIIMRLGGVVLNQNDARLVATILVAAVPPEPSILSLKVLWKRGPSPRQMLRKL